MKKVVHQFCALGYRANVSVSVKTFVWLILLSKNFQTGFSCLSLKDKPGNVTLLVFANKQDLPNAMPVAEVTDILDLPSLHHRRWYIFASFATRLHDNVLCVPCISYVYHVCMPQTC